MTYWTSKPQMNKMHKTTKPQKPTSFQLRTYETYPLEAYSETEKEAIEQAKEYAVQRNAEAKKTTDY
jgi:hypothetical protein